jgi:hypothetical protein
MLQKVSVLVTKYVLNNKPARMPQTHTLRTKNSKKPLASKVKAKVPEVAEEAPEAAFVPAAIKKEPELLEEEVLLPPVEKLEEVSPFGETPVEEDGDDEASLDDEELNPFGDKWEV